MPRVNHFEIPGKKGKITRKFYKETFGWEFSQFKDTDYWNIRTGDPNTPGIDGGLAGSSSMNQKVIVTIDVENIDITIKKIETNGGRKIRDKIALVGIGWLTYFQDPEGTIFAAFQEDQEAS
ncbi:MAG: VOC family protein [Candidatus Kariarchaeaceae archaeon]|jgi:predicted enzyme related to lactoylglutathione lyase